MIRKSGNGTGEAEPEKRESRRARRRRLQQEPLDVHLSLRFKFGEDAEDAITVMDQRRIPMVDSVFRNRDRIIKGFVGLLLKSGLKSPKVVQEIFPALRVLGRKRPERR